MPAVRGRPAVPGIRAGGPAAGWFPQAAGPFRSGRSAGRERLEDGQRVARDGDVVDTYQ
jgi:hypothetical protein